MTGVQYSGIYFSTAVMAVTKHMWVELHFVDVDLTKHKRVESTCGSMGAAQLA